VFSLFDNKDLNSSACEYQVETEEQKSKDYYDVVNSRFTTSRDQGDLLPLMDNESNILYGAYSHFNPSGKTAAEK